MATPVQNRFVLQTISSSKMVQPPKNSYVVNKNSPCPSRTRPKFNCLPRRFAAMWCHIEDYYAPMKVGTFEIRVNEKIYVDENRLPISLFDGIFRVLRHVFEARRSVSREFFFVFAELWLDLVDDTVQRRRDAGTVVARHEIALMVFRRHPNFDVGRIFILEVNCHNNRGYPIKKTPELLNFFFNPLLRCGREMAVPCRDGYLHEGLLPEAQ
jgi:hypothetical protein